jgi:dihydrodipicolinate synthase/N-acetylneuraminate lyase
MRQFQGILTPLITSFDESGKIYEQGIRNLIEFLSSHGVHGVFAVGSYGQFPMMDVSERKRVAEIVLSEVKARGMQAVVQVGAPGQREVLELADHAVSAGADAIASVVPFYYSGVGYGKDIILDHYETLVKAVDVPVHFYNNPKTTGYSLTPEVLSDLIDVGVRGIKDSGANLVLFGEMMNVVLKKCPEFDLMPGSASMLLAGMSLGADACVAGTSAAFPEVVVACYDAVRARDFDKVGDLQLKILEARSIQGTATLRPAACYDLLKLRGIDVGTSRKPWRRLTAQEIAVVKAMLKDADLP